MQIMHGRESSRSLRCAHRLLNGLWRDGLSRRGLRRCHWRRPLLSPQGFHTLLQFLNLLHQKTNGRLITGANCLRRTHPGQQTERNDYLADVGHARPCLFRSAQRDARNHSSYERGCQEKKLLPPPLEKTRVWMTYIQPHLILGG